MSTRCTLHFHYGSVDDDYDTEAIIYRHSDGYPDHDSGVLASLEQFFSDVEEQTKDTRFNDPSYLAAKYVVWQADKFRYRYTLREDGDWAVEKRDRLNFLSLGVMMSDPSDIEYRYHIWCSGGDKPMVTWERTL